MVAVLNPVSGGKPVIVNKAVILIGRHPDCDYVLTKSRKVSRRHCCVVQVNDRYMVRDLGSMNGLWLNGDRVDREAAIGLGDEISVGDVVFRFEDVQSLPGNGSGNNGGANAEPGPGIVTPPDDLQLSKDYPVAIPDQDQSFEVLETINESPDPAGEEFLPVMDVEETFDEDEIEQVVLLDEPEFLDDDDVVILDED